jgi:beta-phosphoglucomutase-like phosphatase (HAD superfamily)
VAAVLVLDFDGTVLDTEWPAYQAAAELWASFDVELTVSDWAWRIGTAGHDDPFVELQRRLGHPLDPALNEQRIARKNELTDQAPLNGGVLEWLDEAESLGVAVGIASSSPQFWVERNLERLGLRERFGCLACCGDALPAKPDPTSYRHAVEQLGGFGGGRGLRPRRDGGERRRALRRRRAPRPHVAHGPDGRRRRGRLAGGAQPGRRARASS